jgi:hypothetical protein
VDIVLLRYEAEVEELIVDKRYGEVHLHSDIVEIYSIQMIGFIYCLPNITNLPYKPVKGFYSLAS